MKVLIKKITTIEDACFCDKADDDSGSMEKPDYISDSRWEKLQCLKNTADKRRSLTAGYLLHQMCKEMHIANPSYGYSEKGKPYLTGHDDISFNISHSGDYVVLAYQKGKEPVGIDIQQIRSIRDSMKKRILHEQEQIPEYISKEETKFLNRIWAVKESYVKMTGDGLTYDLRNVYVDFENRRIIDKDTECAVFIEKEPLPGYVMAVCTTKESALQIIEC